MTRLPIHDFPPATAGRTRCRRCGHEAVAPTDPTDIAGWAAVFDTIPAHCSRPDTTTVTTVVICRRCRNGDCDSCSGTVWRTDPEDIARHELLRPRRLYRCGCDREHPARITELR